MFGIVDRSRPSFNANSLFCFEFRWNTGFAESFDYYMQFDINLAN